MTNNNEDFIKQKRYKNYLKQIGYRYVTNKNGDIQYFINLESKMKLEKTDTGIFSGINESIHINENKFPEIRIIKDSLLIELTNNSIKVCDALYGQYLNIKYFLYDDVQINQISGISIFMGDPDTYKNLCIDIIQGVFAARISINGITHNLKNENYNEYLNEINEKIEEHRNIISSPSSINIFAEYIDTFIKEAVDYITTLKHTNRNLYIQQLERIKKEIVEKQEELLEKSSQIDQEIKKLRKI